jgi:hypothetical protein
LVLKAKNMGVYDSAWWWYYSVDGETLGWLLDGKRLVSLDPYFMSDGLRFAAVIVPNAGSQDRAWRLYWGQDAESVGQLLEENNARLVDIRP